MIGSLKMVEFLEKFEEMLDEVINIGTDKDFEEFKKKVINRLNEID